MVSADHRFLCSKLPRIEQDPSDTVLERNLAVVGVRSALFDNLTHLDEAFVCSGDDFVHAVEYDGRPFEQMQAFVPDFDQMLKIPVACLDEFETAADLRWDLVDVDTEENELVGRMESRHGAGDGIHA